MSFSKKEFSIRPSQVTRTFGPGSIYDNQEDSVIVMGLEYWTDKEKFKTIHDELLMMSIATNKRTANVDTLVSTSSFVDHEDKGQIPIRSFPTWGFCPKCSKLVNERSGPAKGMECNSMECEKDKKEKNIPLPKTYPVRFVIACKNGHLDDFPWYAWIHTNDAEREACGEKDAKLYLIDEGGSISLESKKLVCRNPKCIARPKTMNNSLTKNGLKGAGVIGCTKTRPWLGPRGTQTRCIDKKTNGPVQMRGIFKGATNMYFPMVQSAVTIPPFSDELSSLLSPSNLGPKIERAFRIAKNPEQLLDKIDAIIPLKEVDENARWTLEEIKEKKEKINEFKKKGDRDIYKIEFDQLNSGEILDDPEFTTENVNVKEDSDLGKYMDKIVLVKKCRVVSAITGFTRIDSLDSDERPGPASIARENYSWLPVVENRGEGLFFSFNNDLLNNWQSENNKLETRINKMSTYQGQTLITAKKDKYHTPKYVFLHTLSHAIIKSLGKLAGYSVASFSERIYCDDDMAGVFIFTSSPSSDGALGGLVELGVKELNTGNSKIWPILKNAIQQSSTCSCDPLCSIQEPEKTQQEIGAACHACCILPETCCERMNFLLDREMIHHTLHNKDGFLRELWS